MRKLLICLLMFVLAFMCVASAEGVEQTGVNGRGTVRTGTELYSIIPGAEKDILIRISSSGEAIRVDSADNISGLIPYAGGAAYLKTDNGVSSIMLCSGSTRSTMFAFDNMVCEKLCGFGDSLVVMSNGLLYRVDPNNQICMKLSGAQVLDYTVAGDKAYYLSGTDMMQYSAEVPGAEENVTVTAEVGCIYALDLNTGETTLLLKSGGTDPEAFKGKIYFHSLQQLYAVRTGDGFELRGRLYSLDINQKNLESVCSGEDNGFWATDAGVVAWYNGALTLIGEEEKPLYAPMDGAYVSCDGARLYVWEQSERSLTMVQTNGDVDVLFKGDPETIKDISQASVPPLFATAMAAAAPTPEPAFTEVDAPIHFEDGTESIDSIDAAMDAEGDTEEDLTAEPTPLPTPIPAAVDLDGNGVYTAIEPQGYEDETTDEDSWFDGFEEESARLSGEEVETEPARPVMIIDDTMDTANLITSSIGRTNYMVTEDYASMRLGPNSEYEKVDAIPYGTIVEGMGVAARIPQKDTNWYKVVYNGHAGYVFSKYLEATNQAAASNLMSIGAPIVKSSEASDMVSTVATTTESGNGQYVVVRGDSVYVRKGPGTENEILTAIEAGGYAEYLGETAKAENGKDWYKVSCNGKTGWCAAAYTKITDTKPQKTSTSSSSKTSSSSGKKVRTTGDVTIRKKPDKTSKNLGYIPGGTTVKYLGSSSVDYRGVRWYKIKYDGITGWISSKYSKLK